MSTPRRRLIRLHQPPADYPQTDRQIQKLRLQLEAERNALRRWMARLKRAFHTVEKLQHRINRIENRLARTEEPQ